MKRETFNTIIYASREKVWRVLWGEDTYPVWTSFFSKGSRAESEWQEGGKVLFLNGNNEGMVSRIAEKRDNEFMSFEHVGFVDKDGREDLESEEVRSWAGSTENYTLKEEGSKTELIVKLDVDEKHLDHFKDVFPLALNKVKELSEDKILP